MKENFAFIDGFKDLFNIITDSMQQDGVAPTFTLDFANARSKYDYGGKAIAINFDWYVEYKPSVDKIIIMFTYVLFILNVYRQLPGIINGGASIVSHASDIERHGGKK